MGWFFGCFGGSGKKDRKHKISSSPLPKQQKPLQYAAPRCIPAAVSSSVPIKAAPVQDRTPTHADLFTVRQVSCSVPLRNIQGGACLQNAVAGCQNQETLQKPGPWFQLDDLEQELEDLRKQIDKESQDTKKIKEEVSIFRCGSLIKNPSELKSPQKVDYHQGSMSEGGWRSWLDPSASLNTRNSPINNIQFEGLKAALCEPTPTKECHSLLLGVQTPVSSTRVLQSSDHQSTRAQVLEQQVDQFKNGDILGTNDDPLPRQDDIKLKQPADMNPAQKSSSISNPCLDNEGIHNKGQCFDIKLDGLIPKPKGILKQANRSVCGMENKSRACEDDNEIENNSTKKRRLGVNVASVQQSHALKKSEENDASSLQDSNALCQKRLRVVSPREQSMREPNSSLSQADPLPTRFLRCKSLSPILESGTPTGASTNYGNTGMSQEPSRQLCSYNSMSQVSSQSPTLRHSPASQTKSLTFASTNDEDNTTDDLSYNYGAIERCSERSYTNSAHFNEEDEDGSATVSCSSSTDSEETLSDLSPEHCFSPLVSPSLAKSSSIYRSQDNSASTHGLKTVKSQSISSTQYSSVYGGRKKQHAYRYDSEDDDSTEDDHDLYTDAMSHVSTECSEGEPRRWHGRTESTDSVSAHFTQMGQTTDLNLIDTPPKLSEGLATPNVDIPGRAGQQTSRLRSKPASSVLTPVENVSQWKQLREKDHKVDVSAKAGKDEVSKADLLKSAKRIEGPKPSVWDENKNLSWTSVNKAAGKQLASQWGTTSDAKSIYVNASLSQQGIAPQAESIRVDASLAQWGTATTQTEHVRVDMSLSHWLGSSSKHNEALKAIGISTVSSSSGEGDVVSPAPKVQQTKDYASPNSAMRAVTSQFSSYVVSERPILGGLGGDGPSRNAKQRSPWDGKGTPNSTAKYMEDQRVKWHATPFEQRLEKALDKQGILLQKKLFTATAPAVL